MSQGFPDTAIQVGLKMSDVKDLIAGSPEATGNHVASCVYMKLVQL
jgi:hypothetical protein